VSAIAISILAIFIAAILIATGLEPARENRPRRNPRR